MKHIYNRITRFVMALALTAAAFVFQSSFLMPVHAQENNIIHYYDAYSAKWYDTTLRTDEYSS